MALAKLIIGLQLRAISPTLKGQNTQPKRSKHSFVSKILDPAYNKGLAFSMVERQRLSIQGLLPCSFRDQDEQLSMVKANFNSRKSFLSRYRYLLSLRIRHQNLFYRFISENTESVMPVIYTPTVGLACTMFGQIFRSVTGVFISGFDRGHIVDVLRNWPEYDVRAVCVTDGERVLGLGDLGAHGMAIPMGKVDLYTALGRVPPQQLLPIALDVGTDNEVMRADPLYIGTRVNRLRGKEYDEFMQEFMDAVVTLWGHKTLIHFEDFATPNALSLLKKYQKKYCCFNDDIQGTAATGLAGMLVIERATKKKLDDHVVLFVGAGSAVIGISMLLRKELIQRGNEESKAAKNIYICNEHGLINKESKNIPAELTPFMKDDPVSTKLLDLVENIKPSIILGATGMGGLFSEPILRSMAKNHERPAVLALSNPTNKAECSAEQAYKFTEGRVLFASGSPFPPVLINEKRYTTGQANNCLAFPGIALGALSVRAHYIPDGAFIIAAHTLANYTSEENMASGSIYPAIKTATEVAFYIGVEVAQYLIDSGVSNLYPVPNNVCEYIQAHLYNTGYSSCLPPEWKYPDLPMLRIPKDLNFQND